MKKAGVYDPYLDTLGGGERYAMTMAHCLAKRGWQVDVFGGNKKIKGKLEKRFGFSLKRINFIPDIFDKKFFEKMKLMRDYNFLFFLSDGSIPFLFAEKNILHFQVPFHGVDGKKPLNKIKLKKINAVICNSQFTKKTIDQEYGINSKVIYPPVAVKEFKPGRKENIILSVGRFSRLMQSKRQDVLVDSFIKLNQKVKDWQLILAGGTDVGKDKAFDQLKKKAENLPVKIVENPSFSELKKIYAQAKIFWNAAGFGIDEEKEPEKVEHFGITTVEAMAAGCIPMVVDKGGQSEIVSHSQNGLLWKSRQELVSQTLKLIKDEKLREKLAKSSQKRAQNFSQTRFCQEIGKLSK